ncbi:MAG: hypothetical protein KAH06_04055 [Desulfobacterales bacterium]|nr:hypothetical protein [Desulfobacterales bacterium]
MGSHRLCPDICHIDDHPPGSVGAIFSTKHNHHAITPSEIPENDTWMNLYLKDKKIGYAHSVLIKQDSGFHPTSK